MPIKMILLCPLLFVTLHLSAFSESVDVNQTVSTNNVCQFSISNNDTLFKKLSKHFNKKSRTIIIEYTIKLDNGSSDLYQGSNYKSFQPWRWYRTQGAGNSHVLLTYDFYFGILKSILTLGIRQFEINIDVNELGCSNMDSDKFDLLIRDILLQDFKISGNSTYRVYPKSDDVEVCTARIEETSDGHGELVFRCCSFDSEKKIFCDDKSMNMWGYALNIVIIIVSIFLVVGFLAFVLKENKMELYDYSPADLVFKYEIRTISKNLAYDPRRSLRRRIPHRTCKERGDTKYSMKKSEQGE